MFATLAGTLCTRCVCLSMHQVNVLLGHRQGESERLTQTGWMWSGKDVRAMDGGRGGGRWVAF